MSFPNCNKMLIFGKQAFFIMLFVSILINPLISKIGIFMMSHFSTLLDKSYANFALLLKKIVIGQTALGSKTATVPEVW